MKKTRIAKVRTKTFFGDPVIWYAVQVRVALFWWVTVGYADNIVQARNMQKHQAAAEYKVIRIVE